MGRVTQVCDFPRYATNFSPFAEAKPTFYLQFATRVARQARFHAGRASTWRRKRHGLARPCKPSENFLQLASPLVRKRRLPFKRLLRCIRAERGPERQNARAVLRVSLSGHVYGAGKRDTAPCKSAGTVERGVVRSRTYLRVFRNVNFILYTVAFEARKFEIIFVHVTIFHWYEWYNTIPPLRIYIFVRIGELKLARSKVHVFREIFDHVLFAYLFTNVSNSRRF